MTEEETESSETRPSRSAPVFTLATDLDGTFLGGAPADRAALYGWIEEHRNAVELIFVTGRDLPFIEASCADGALPWPDYVVGDVGATIAKREKESGAIRPSALLEAHIARLWGEGIAEIEAALDAAPGIAPQDGPFRHRMSYHYDPATFDPAIQSVIEAAGFDCLISDNRFLDILPKGVSKGPSLLRLLAHLRAAHERVLVAGDTLNDRSMFETGLRGVAVGNSEPALVEAIAGRANVYFATGFGAAGVFEAIDALGFRAAVTEAAAPDALRRAMV